MKKYIDDTRLFHFVRTNWIKLKQYKKVKEWIDSGFKKRPPHLIKQKIVKSYLSEYKLQVFIETGTFRGDMIEALKDDFDLIYSIELSQKFYLKAKKRFDRYAHINIIQGDSGKVLESVLANIKKPVLFWLDGHYSAGDTAKGEEVTPIFKELDSIFARENIGDIVLIDDARLFKDDRSYPSLIELKEFINDHQSNVIIEISHDIIRIVPKQFINSF